MSIWFVFDYFSSLWVILTCFLACLLIFDRMSDIVNLALLGAGYICIPENSYLCSTSDYSERAWSSWLFLLRFVSWDGGEIFRLAGGNKLYSLESFWLVLFLALGSFWIWTEAFIKLCWLALGWTLRGTSLASCTVNGSCLGLLRFSAPSPPRKEHTGLCRFPCLRTGPKTLSGSNLRKSQG